MKNKILIACILIMTVGCSRQVLYLDSSPYQSGTIKSREKEIPFYVGGLGQTAIIDAARICGGSNRVSAVETVYSPIDFLIGLYSVGIYLPKTYQVYCVR